MQLIFESLQDATISEQHVPVLNFSQIHYFILYSQSEFSFLQLVSVALFFRSLPLRKVWFRLCNNSLGEETIKFLVLSSAVSARPAPSASPQVSCAPASGCYSNPPLGSPVCKQIYPGGLQTGHSVPDAVSRRLCGEERSPSSAR